MVLWHLGEPGVGPGPRACSRCTPAHLVQCTAQGAIPFRERSRHRSRQQKRGRQSEGALAKVRAQLIGSIAAGSGPRRRAARRRRRCASKPDGTWRICYDSGGLYAVMRSAAEPLQHIDALLGGTGGGHTLSPWTHPPRSGRQLSLAAGAGSGLVKDELLWSQLRQLEWSVTPRVRRRPSAPGSAGAIAGRQLPAIARFVRALVRRLIGGPAGPLLGGGRGCSSLCS